MSAFDPAAGDSGALLNDLQVAANHRLIEALVDSERRMRMRLDLLSEVVFELNDAAHIVFLNKAWANVLGMTHDAAIGRPLCTFVLPDDAPALLQVLAAPDAHSQQRRPCLRFMHADGAPRWMEISVATRPGGGHIGELKDVTFQRRTQDELERMSLVANHTDNMVIITDQCGRIEWVNTAFIRQTGYSPEEVFGRVPGHLLQGPQTSAEEVARIARLVRAGESFQSEIMNYKKSGQAYWTTLFVTPIFGPDGRLQRHIAVQSDSTQLRNAQAQLQEEKTRADAANKAKSEFLSTMSHELRTPLNGILGMAQLLKLPQTSSTEHSEYVDAILSSGNLLLGILNDILELSKIEAGKFALRPGNINMERMMAETKLLYCQPAWSKALVLDMEWLGPASMEYVGDALRIKQVLNNLVNNAIKFTTNGWVRVQGREIRRQGKAARVEFVIEDTGIGIPEDKQALLFKPFSQVDSSDTRAAGGTGLGLSIVRRLTELMGGNVTLRSTYGQGTVITVQIELEALDEAPQPRPVAGVPAQDGARRSTPDATPQQGIKRALIVEDTPVNVVLMQAFLKRLGIQSIHVGNGQEAVNYVADHERPDIVFMDCQMPVMDGYEATRQIRAFEQEKQPDSRMAIVALTASAFEEDRDRCLASGMDDFMTKPLNFDLLKSVVHKWTN